MSKQPFEFKDGPAGGTGSPVGTDAVPPGIADMMPSSNPSLEPPTLATIRQAASPAPVESAGLVSTPTSKVLGPDGQPRRMVQGNVSNRSNLPHRPGDDLPEPMPKGTKVKAFQPAPGDIVIGGM